MTTSRKTPAAAGKVSNPTVSKTKAAMQKDDVTKTSAEKKATRPKTATTEKAPRKATSAKKAGRGAASAAAAGTVQTPQILELTPEQRHSYIEVAAYYIAERRGFRGGSELEDWLQAEAEIDRLLREGILKP